MLIVESLYFFGADFAAWLHFFESKMEKLYCGGAVVISPGVQAAAALQKIMQGEWHAWYNHTVKLSMHGGAGYERHQIDI